MQLNLNLACAEQWIRVNKFDIVQWESKETRDIVQAIVIDVLDHEPSALQINRLDSPNNGIIHVTGKLAVKDFQVIKTRQNKEFKMFKKVF